MTGVADAPGAGLAGQQVDARVRPESAGRARGTPLRAAPP